ncbi:hypothetical protein [Xanthomonas sp. NCPPB 2632]|uniref:hypothetical protein n=1 Tax=Xanthomonas sp. NCPPB 2632 TaxID=3240912 RepID=UPI003515DDC4
MSLGDLHNPRAAARVYDEFRRRYQQRVCLAPFAEHSGGVVAAHTLAVGSVLRPISRDARVYALNTRRLVPNQPHFQLAKLGIGDVSSLHAFCASHDKSLFSCVEDEPFRFSPEQRFKMAYRAAARECYLKRKQFDSFPKLEDMAEIHGIDTPVGYTQEAMIHQASILKGAEEAEAFKAALDVHLLTGDWGRVVTAAVVFEKRPSVVATFAFGPFFNLDGTELQLIDDLETSASLLSISVIPLEVGGAAIFSWLDTANSAPRSYFESVAKSTDLTAAVLHVIFDNGENFAIAPDWYESLSDLQKNYIDSRLPIQEAGFEYEVTGRPESTAPFLDDWGSAVTTYF